MMELHLKEGGFIVQKPKQNKKDTEHIINVNNLIINQHKLPALDI